MKRTNFLIIAVILLFPLTLGAVPQLLNHQGHMLTNHGVPVVGSANVTFNLYADETGGDSVWTQTIPVTFDVGRYSVLLGPGEPELSIALFTGSNLYLGVTLEGQEEFLPRMHIASMPYAFRAEAVEGEVKAIGGLIVDGEVVINDQQQWVGTNISFNDLADIPEDLADGDDVGIEGSGTNGTIARFTESGLGDSVVVELDSKIGIGTDDPQATLQIAGGMQIEDDTDDCAEGKEGTLRWHGNKVEVCDGSDWASIAGSSIGHSPTNAGASCKSILDAGASQGSGVYWINPDGNGGEDPFEAYCDMETHGGGWTLVANVAPNDGNSVGYNNQEFWSTDAEYGAFANRFSHDYKSKAAYLLTGSHVMTESTDTGSDGAILGWRSWPFTSNRTWDSMFYVGIIGVHGTDSCETGSPDAVDVGSTSSWDDIIRQGSCIYTDVNPSSSGEGDTMRLTVIPYNSQDNKMAGFASCIDCGAGWQGTHRYMGQDRAGCNSSSCAYSQICHMSSADCLGNYCSQHYGTVGTTCDMSWNSRFFVR